MKNDDHDPEQDDRPTPVPEGDAPWVAEWRLSAQGCWTEPSNDDD